MPAQRACVVAAALPKADRSGAAEAHTRCWRRSIALAHHPSPGATSHLLTAWQQPTPAGCITVWHVGGHLCAVYWRPGRWQRRRVFLVHCTSEASHPLNHRQLPCAMSVHYASPTSPCSVTAQADAVSSRWGCANEIGGCMTGRDARRPSFRWSSSRMQVDVGHWSASVFTARNNKRG